MNKSIRDIVIIVGLFFSLLLATWEIIQLKQELNTKSDTITGLLSSKRVYKTKSGELAHEVKSLTITQEELLHSNDSLLLTIDNMKIKLKHVMQATQVVTESSINLTLPLKDSIVYIHDTIRETIIPDTLKTFCHNDNYNKIEAVIDLQKDSAYFNQHSTDSLSAVLHKGKRDIWWKVWNKRPIVLTIVNTNPQVEIKYSRHLKINRR